MSTKIKLSTGEWPFSEVLPHDWTDYFLVAGEEPERPFDEKEIVGGGTEKVTPPDDDPRWKAYGDALTRWNRQAQEFEWLMAFADVEVPDGWALPSGKALALGIEPNVVFMPRDHKLLYIRHVILGTREDIAEVSRLASGVITEKERAAGAVKFPGSEADEEGLVGTA